MRKFAIAAACLIGLAGCVSGQAPVVGSAVGSLAGTAGAASAAKISKSKTGTTILSIACRNAAPILEEYVATELPAAAPFIPAAVQAVGGYCGGALPNGTSTTAAAALVNTALAVVLGSHLME